MAGRGKKIAAGEERRAVKKQPGSGSEDGTKAENTEGRGQRKRSENRKGADR